jgi:hypothetical protein
MSETWTISVDGRLYGPYTADQLRAFHAEGRLAPHSLVAQEGDAQFHPAGEDPILAALFSAAETPVAPESIEPVAETALESETRVQAPAQHEPHRFGAQPSENVLGERSRFVILSDMKSGSIANLEEEIFKLGHAFRFMPQAWVLTSEASLNTIRHALMQKLGKLDTIFVVDTVHDRAAWFNFGPEADTRVRRMWSRTPEGARKTG